MSRCKRCIRECSNCSEKLCTSCLQKNKNCFNCNKTQDVRDLVAEPEVEEYPNHDSASEDEDDADKDEKHLKKSEDEKAEERNHPEQELQINTLSLQTIFPANSEEI